MANNNTTTKKQFGGIADNRKGETRPTKDVGYSNRGGKNTGQMSGRPNVKFGDPMNSVNAKIGGLEGTHNDIGELSGFITDGYLDKGGMEYGENTKLNYLPPGMDISNQMNAEIHDMPLRTVVDISYPGDGWQPTPRDIEE